MILDKPDLLQYVQNLGVPLKKLRTGEYQGPCPVCGGTDRFHIKRDLQGWGCRHCTPQSGGVFDLIAKVSQISVEDAMRRHRESNPAPVVKRDFTPETRPRSEARGDYLEQSWQRSARDMVIKGMSALKDSAEAQQYLCSRGLERETWSKFRLGFDAARGAIVIPWAGRNSLICAIKFRVLTDDKTKRFQQLKGGSQVLFGGHLARRLSTAIITEGEINAMSLWQTCNDVADVLSFGGDTNSGSLPEVLKHYTKAIIWVDSPKRSAEIAGKLAATNVRYFHSPNDLDANDILVQAGPKVLRSIIEGLL